MSAIVVEQQLMLCRGVKLHKSACLDAFYWFKKKPYSYLVLYDGRGNILSTKFMMKPR